MLLSHSSFGRLKGDVNLRGLVAHSKGVLGGEAAEAAGAVGMKMDD